MAAEERVVEKVGQPIKKVADAMHHTAASVVEHVKPKVPGEQHEQQHEQP
jgi:hypothetical protein